MNDNVIKFPSKKTQSSNSDEEEILLIVETIWMRVLEDMRKAGYDFSADTEKYFPSMVLMFEAMRSLAMMEKDLEHPLQHISEELFGFNKYEAENTKEQGEMSIDEIFSFIENISKETVDS
jgi:hypothetical protein